MVRTIDGDRRRRELAEAVWQVIIAGGLEAASVRRVAEEAGLATGSVRHFFPSQADLHVFAMRELTVRVAARIEETNQITDPGERAVAMVTSLLPLTDESHAEFTAWLQFVTRSTVDPRLADAARTAFDQIRSMLVRVVEGQVELGLIPADTDIMATAVRLNTVLDGLTLELLVAPHLITRQEARRIVVRQLTDPVRNSE